ncbi:MAG: PAS domain-containing sensor histidine kinase [Calditrichaceae bacterium]
MRKLIRIPYLIMIFMVLAGLMLVSALIELNQSKKELYELMDQNANSILEAITQASVNNLAANQAVESELVDRLLDNARFLNYLDSKSLLNPAAMMKIAKENLLLEILLFDKSGKYVNGITAGEINRQQIETEMSSWLPDILESDENEYIIGFHNEGGQHHYSVSVRREKGGVIVVSIDSNALLQFRKKIGFGKLIAEISDNEHVVFLALQDTSGILAATKNVVSLERIEDDPVLKDVFEKDISYSREKIFNDELVYEVIHPFEYNSEVIGIFRMGLALGGVEAINERILRRLIIISGVLVLIGFLLFTLMSVKQQYDVVNNQYGVVQTYYGNILQNIADGVISYDKNGRITMINKAAGEILGSKYAGMLDEDISKLPVELFDVHAERPVPGVKEFMMRDKVIALARSSVKDHNGDDLTMILVIRDLTEQRLLEEQIKQKEKLSAMGKLASGVAHEIRNPLNAISTIVQQFDIDFEPKENSDEYHSLAKLVGNEVRRLNEIINQFVEFARPKKPAFHECKANALFDEILQLTRKEAAAKNIEVEAFIDDIGIVVWDGDQIKQSLLNLTKNAVESFAGEGLIRITVKNQKDIVKIKIEDNGEGISEENLNKMFDLYFTTKQSGTGLGLSIVHRIITDHKGTISAESKSGQGTAFYVQLPKIAERQNV